MEAPRAGASVLRQPIRLLPSLLSKKRGVAPSLFVSGETDQAGKAAAAVVFPIGDDENRIIWRLNVIYVSIWLFPMSVLWQ